MILISLKFPHNIIDTECWELFQEEIFFPNTYSSDEENDHVIYNGAKANEQVKHSVIT